MNRAGKTVDFFAQVTGGSDLSGISTAHSLEELSSPEFFGHQCAEIDAMASRVVDESRILDAINSAVAECQFCVSIADPRLSDFPLIAVSEKFQAITGFHRTEVIGKNCRFMNEGCWMDTGDLMSLRSACSTGASFTAILTNRRKSGELFFNLLDLRGLTVARNPQTGEELWFLVGIQCDVTSVHFPEVQEDQLTRIHMVANDIRAKLTDELSAMAVAGALKTSHFGVAPSASALRKDPPNAWCLLPVPIWRCVAEAPFSPSGFGSCRFSGKLGDDVAVDEWLQDSGCPDGSMTKQLVVLAVLALGVLSCSMVSAKCGLGRAACARFSL